VLVLVRWQEKVIAQDWWLCPTKAQRARYRSDNEVAGVGVCRDLCNEG
jgi:hypothetical protein